MNKEKEKDREGFGIVVGAAIVFGLFLMFVVNMFNGFDKFNPETDVCTEMCGLNGVEDYCGEINFNFSEQFFKENIKENNKLCKSHRPKTECELCSDKKDCTKEVKEGICKCDKYEPYDLAVPTFRCEEWKTEEELYSSLVKKGIPECEYGHYSFYILNETLPREIDIKQTQFVDVLLRIAKLDHIQCCFNYYETRVVNGPCLKAHEDTPEYQPRVTLDVTSTGDDESNLNTGCNETIVTFEDGTTTKIGVC